MKKFQTMGELISYMVGANAPNELKAEAENQDLFFKPLIKKINNDTIKPTNSVWSVRLWTKKLQKH